MIIFFNYIGMILFVVEILDCIWIEQKQKRHQLENLTIAFERPIGIQILPYWQVSQSARVAEYTDWISAEE